MSLGEEQCAGAWCWLHGSTGHARRCARHNVPALLHHFLKFPCVHLPSSHPPLPCSFSTRLPPEGSGCAGQQRSRCFAEMLLCAASWEQEALNISQASLVWGWCGWHNAGMLRGACICLVLQAFSRICATGSGTAEALPSHHPHHFCPP